MTCDRFEPITSSVVPCCVACSHRGACEKENAAQDATNIQDGKAEQNDTRSASIVYEI